MVLPDIPGRVFLDTSVVNFVLDFGEQIHDTAPPPENLSEYQLRDIDALCNIFRTGKRASWRLAVSPHTYYEVLGTNDATRQYWLENWFFEVWEYWREIVNQNNDLPTFIEAENLRVKIMSSGILDILPDFSDRVLLIDAAVYRCDCFCTRDWVTVLKHRDNLKGIGIPIVTPSEWWNMIKPYAGLWG